MPGIFTDISLSFFSLELMPSTETMSNVGKKSIEHRKGGYKNIGFGKDDIRKRREETTIEIRRNKKEESLQKRRQYEAPSDGMDGEDDRPSGFLGASSIVSLFPSFFSPFVHQTYLIFIFVFILLPAP